MLRMKLLHLKIFAAVKTLVFLGVAICGATCCSSSKDTGTEDVLGNEGGSTPVNDNEAAEYKKAIIRCYKTGGTRIVKIMGTLKCY